MPGETGPTMPYIIGAKSVSIPSLAGWLLSGAIVLSASLSTSVEARSKRQCEGEYRICKQTCRLVIVYMSACMNQCATKKSGCLSRVDEASPKNTAGTAPGTSPPRAPLNKRPGSIGGGAADPGSAPTKSRNPVAKGNYQKATPVIQRRNR